ncbi:MAG: hypothetical protein GY725_05465 [bacterium]|nr:hypothetical protein [bacterium]
MKSASVVRMATVCLLAFAGPLSAQTPEPDEPLSSQSPQPGAPLARTSQRGPVTVTVGLSPSQPVIGDELSLKIEVLAEEAVELLMPEFGEALDRFRVIDFSQSESVDPDGRTRAVQTYTLASPMSGKHRVSPLLVEFVDRRQGKTPAPEGEDAYEILTERLDFEVASVLPTDAVAKLPSPPGRLEPLDRAVSGVWGLVVGILVLLLAAVFFGLRILQRRRAFALQRTAWEIADARLLALLAEGRPEDLAAVQAFYVELSDLVRTYLENRFELRSPELTTEEFFEVARTSPDLTPELQALLRDFLEQADLVKFARHQPGTAEMDAALESVRNVLEATRDVEEREEPVSLLGPEPAHG